MINKIKEIPCLRDYSEVKFVSDGWSHDKKYYVKTKAGKERLVRFSDIAKYEAKQHEFEILNQLNGIDIPVAKPVEFGVSSDHKHVYLIYTWIKGKPAAELIAQSTTEQQYNAGCQFGRILKKLHSISVERHLKWETRFNRKLDRNIRSILDCPVKFPGYQAVIDFINANRTLLNDRPQTAQHGDYHIGNFLLDDNLNPGVIDLDRFDIGDPWEEFNRITWCADKSRTFASGRINGYFEDDVPKDFFPLLALYIGSNMLSSLPWALQWGEDQIGVILEQIEKVMNDYHGFTSSKPVWYSDSPETAIY